MSIAFEASGQGPVLVVLHGLFGDRGNWRSLARSWENRFRVVRADLPGHGASADPREWTPGALAEALEAERQRQGWGRVHLLGHSLGGLAALAWTLSFPEAAASVISLDLGPGPQPGRHEALVGLLPQCPAEADGAAAEVWLRGQGVDPGIAAFLRKGRQELNRGGLVADGLPDSGAQTFAWRWPLAALARDWPRLWMGLPSHPWLGRALLVAGGRSNYIDKSQRGAWLQRFPQGQVQTLEGAGHWMHLDRPRELMNLLDLWWNRG